MDAPVDPATDAEALAPLVAQALDPLFWRPSRLGVESAWVGHIPFAHWVVAAARPSVLVELGTHNGVSYCAFCDAVMALQLDTRCFAVDTWEGDAHAGFYGEAVFDGLRRFHDSRYAGFSKLLRCTFDAALAYMPDRSIDLLHIDGCHGYNEVRHDFESWQPKLSDRAVVLFHDTHVRERGFGVWRLFGELRERYAGFEFLHAHGLGVLAVGRDVSAPVAALCALDDPGQIAALRERFSLLGERWEAEERARLAAAAPQNAIESARMRARAAQRASEARAAASEALAELDRMRKATAERLKELETAAAAGHAAINEAARLRLKLRRAAELTDDAAAYARLRHSMSWRVTAPLRAVAARVPAQVSGGLQRAVRLAQASLALRLRSRLRHDARLRHERTLLTGSELFDPAWYSDHYSDVTASGLDPVDHYLRHGRRERRHPGPRFDVNWYLEQFPDVATSDVDPLVHYLSRGAAEGRPIRALPAELTAPTSETARRVVLISAEPETPGHVYRVVRFAEAAAQTGAAVSCLHVPEIDHRRDEILSADVLVIWRATWPQVAGAVAAAREGGATVVFDLDDLMLDPDLATPELLDALRTGGVSQDDARGHYRRIHDAVMQSDFCLASTEELAWHMRRTGRPVLVLPNGFDDAVRSTSRRAARRRQRHPAADDVLRIGYAGGTRTHQRDFAVVAETLGKLLRERSNCRLVLFKSPADQLPIVDPAEFPALGDVAGQIEWRDAVAVERLPLEIARFDVNVAPLQVGNPFCESKSELKYFEAALVDVCTVASPTGPFRRAIRHGETGFLATTPDEWHAAVSALLDDPALRRRMATAARHDVLWRFGPERRRELVASVLQQVTGGRDAAHAFALHAQLAMQKPPLPAPPLPQSEVLFASDRLGDADVTVIVPLYNYAHFVPEALESVTLQTLRTLDLVVIDDASTDASRAVALQWAQAHAPRFNRVVVIGNAVNAGLGATRNAGFAAAETPYVLPLDADNRLLPACCERLLREARRTGAAFVYPVLQEFGDSTKLANVQPYVPARLIGVPYIDAMALVSVAAWAAVGGYSDTRLGWEDYEFWCRMAERGLFGQQFAGEPLAEYRVHRDSLLLAVTESADNKPRVMADITARHPWLSLVEARQR